MALIPVSIHADTFSAVPYVKAHAGTMTRVHHARMTSAMNRLARQIWGEHAVAIRHTQDVYSFVWCEAVVPSPSFLEGKTIASWHGTLDITE